MDSVCLSNGPFSNYYAQESSDDGIIMESDIPVTEVRVRVTEVGVRVTEVRVRVTEVRVRVTEVEESGLRR